MCQRLGYSPVRVLTGSRSVVERKELFKNNLAVSFSWTDGVVPFGQDGMSRHSHGGFRFLGYLDLGRVEPCIQRCLATEARARPCSTNVLQHNFIAGQRFA